MTKATASAGDLETGSLVNERYRVVGVVGRGGLATVYRAEDKSLGRTVALKVISGSLGDAGDARRHQDEVRLIAGFDHPSLVTLFDFVPMDDGPTAMLVMQFVDGTNLASRIARGALSPELTAEIGVDVASALAHIHARGVMHRDVKPANILLPKGADAPAAMLADFGIARLVDDAGVTVTGTIVGTASYLSPEQAGGGSLGPSTDIYSLGLVLLECLTGTRAFPGSAVESVAARLATDPAIPESLQPEWASLLADMLAREPATRPEASEVEGRLREIGEPSTGAATLVLPVASAAPTERLVPAAPPPPPTRARRPFPLARVLIIAGTALGLLLLFALIVQMRPPPIDQAVLPTSTPTATAVAEIEYPPVSGELGDALTELQDSVGALSSDAATERLQALVLEITELSADEDYESALETLETLRNEIDNAELTSAERDTIRHATDRVRAELEKLLDDGPGKGDKPHKK